MREGCCRARCEMGQSRAPLTGRHAPELAGDMGTGACGSACEDDDEDERQGLRSSPGTFSGLWNFIQGGDQCDLRCHQSVLYATVASFDSVRKRSYRVIVQAPRAVRLGSLVPRVPIHRC
jgi:hypothetical protein